MRHKKHCKHHKERDNNGAWIAGWVILLLLFLVIIGMGVNQQPQVVTQMGPSLNQPGAQPEMMYDNGNGAIFIIFIFLIIVIALLSSSNTYYVPDDDDDEEIYIEN